MFFPSISTGLTATNIALSATGQHSLSRNSLTETNNKQHVVSCDEDCLFIIMIPTCGKVLLFGDWSNYDYGNGFNSFASLIQLLQLTAELKKK